MMLKLIKIILSLLFVIALALIVTMNTRLHYSPDVQVVDRDTINDDLLMELRGLKQAMQNSADVEMQSLYPEGYVFLNALYGLAWCNFIQRPGRLSPYFKEGHKEVQHSWDKINSDKGRSTFNAELPLPYGAFYTGWCSYLLGRKLAIESIDQRKENEVAEFKKKCESIAAAIKTRTYPTSYYGSAWPADVVVCIASLSLHDKLFEPQYSSIIQKWMIQVKGKLDPALIPHEVDPLSGRTREGARGSSQSLMLIFLREIDPQFASGQFAIYKANFVDTYVGLTGIREYPKGEFGMGDIDSGPVLLNMGAAATIVGMQTLFIYGDYENGLLIRNVIEALAIPIKKDDQKKYLLGVLPMADAFAAWGHSAEDLSRDEKTNFATFHTLSFFIVSVLGGMLWLIWKPKKMSKSLHILW
ncbi:MAG: hypothetical protein ACOYXT_12300 [Bacteroidota bacterium]